MVKKAIAIVVCMLSLTGCYASQRDSIDAQFDREREALDEKCQYNMTAWCQNKYQHIENKHTIAIRENEAAVRRGWGIGIMVTALVFIVGMVTFGEIELQQYR